MSRECLERFPRHRLQMKPLVSDPGMHRGTCVTHVPWCMSGSLNHGSGENVPGILGACATGNFVYLPRDPLAVMALTFPHSPTKIHCDICFIFSIIYQPPSFIFSIICKFTYWSLYCTFSKCSSWNRYSWPKYSCGFPLQIIIFSCPIEHPKGVLCLFRGYVIGLNHGWPSYVKNMAQGTQVDKNRGRKSKLLSSLRPEGHVFLIAWPAIINTYYTMFPL